MPHWWTTRRLRFRLKPAWRRALACIALLLLGAWLGLRLVPLPAALFAPPPAERQFVDRHGLPLRTVRAAGSPFLRPVAYRDVPELLIHSTLAAEDKRFWDHHGVDWQASLRAAWGLLRHGRVISGGSTVTQQLIKLAAPRPRTFRTKLLEAIQALRLEQVWDKQRILVEYLNRLDYGNLNTGCAAAADFYFGKPLRDLSPAECALLAGLPQAPSRLNPLRHRERARNRQQWVLLRMRDDGYLSPDLLARAQAEPLRLYPPRRPFEAPHFVDLLLAQLDRQPVPPASATPLRTTLDLELNRVTEEIVRQHIAGLSEHHVGNGAAVVIDNASGGVLALVGSEDYLSPRSGQVNGAWAPRSAGSTFKPFTYLIAFEQGATPASIVADVPAEFATATGLFAPVNYDHRCHGPMRYRLALANSLNIAAVKVLASIGGPAVLQQRLQACGLTTLTQPPEHYGLGLTIGNAEARLLELANAYACLARLGQYRPFRLVQSEAQEVNPKAESRKPKPIQESKLQTSPTPAPATASAFGLPSAFGLRPSAFSPPARRVFAAADAFLLADILSDNAARALAFGVDSNLRFEFPVACKTGTSSDYRDNWAFGYTPEFTVGVWVGNADGSPMQGISGVTGAAPILHELMQHLHQRYGTSWYPTPTNVVEAPIHAVTGKRLPEPLPTDRTDVVLEKFSAGRLPPLASPADCDADGRIRLPAEYRAWLQTSDNWLGARAVAADTSTLRITFPLPGTTLYLDPDLPDHGRRIHLQVDGPPNLEWRSETLSCHTESGQAFALLTPGRHQLCVRDPHTGLQAETWVTVLER